jgi:hypothetical protein
MKQARKRLDVNLPELDALLDQARHEPLSDPDYLKLKTALHALAGLAAPARNTEKTNAVVGESGNVPLTRTTNSDLQNLDMDATERPLFLVRKT